jgi:hypothetical protein
MKLKIMNFLVFTAAIMKMAVFWDVTLRSLLEISRCFRVALCLHSCPDKGNSASETSEDFYDTTRRNIAEDSHL